MHYSLESVEWPSSDYTTSQELLWTCFTILLLFYDTCTQDGLTCLMLATQKEHSPIVKELLINSADPNITEMVIFFTSVVNSILAIVHIIHNNNVS